jgi:hypothetical protein
LNSSEYFFFDFPAINFLPVRGLFVSTKRGEDQLFVPTVTFVLQTSITAWIKT